ncbi:hypothetical protein [Leeuwenhoekiella sp. UBA6783]|uniref:hypothetical protein n=1 Tax=Leeuwenhoekiella sp. UBA6783 TaxID=1946747 RepID=UPI0025BF03ED|nr:hypothetical protein [Leeuwenhoekiella sp. UBA6783]|tara:strand:+ start:1888 stop:2496 length:609 start_codon:yes stop_codon:yes gene_type:complete
MELFLQICAAIGSLATFGAFLMLFKKDKSKEVQINKLTSIAAVLENQAESLNKQNDLLSQQIDIFRNTSLLTEQNDQAYQELKEIEEKKMKLSVRPNLWLNGATTIGMSGELKIWLNNKGETAILTDFNLIAGQIELHSKHLPYELEKGKERFIFGRAINGKSINEATYQIEVKYKDVLENKFIAKIEGKGASVKITEVKPE